MNEWWHCRILLWINPALFTCLQVGQLHVGMCFHPRSELGRIEEGIVHLKLRDKSENLLIQGQLFSTCRFEICSGSAYAWPYTHRVNSTHTHMLTCTHTCTGSSAQPTSVWLMPLSTQSTMTQAQHTVWKTSSEQLTVTMSHAAALGLRISLIAKRRPQSKERRGNIVHGSRGHLTGTDGGSYTCSLSERSPNVYWSNEWE